MMCELCMHALVGLGITCVNVMVGGTVVYWRQLSYMFVVIGRCQGASILNDYNMKYFTVKASLFSCTILDNTSNQLLLDELLFFNVKIIEEPQSKLQKLQA